MEHKCLCCCPFFTLNSYSTDDDSRTVKIYTKTGDKGWKLGEFKFTMFVRKNNSAS